MSSNQKLNQKGFTLIELLVVVLVMSIMAIVLANFIANWLQISSNQQAQANLLDTAELALTKVASDIRLSGSVDTNNRWPDANGPGGNQYGWTSGSQVLVLAKVAADSGGNPIFTDCTNGVCLDYVTLKDNIIYFLSGTTLYRRTLASGNASDAAVTTCPSSDSGPSCPTDNTVATGVTNWSITYYDVNGTQVSSANARSVQLSITLSSQYGSKPITTSYTTRMVFRND